jgi:uncharacterized protein
MSADSAIVLMAKQPRAGKTKTRLCPPFTPESASLLYEALLKDTLMLAGGLERVQLAVAISPPESSPYFEQITPPCTLLIPVEGHTIGVCLDRSFVSLFERGYQKALAFNTDGPSLPHEYLAQAIGLLDEYDLVLGPGEDGGYYLVGMKQSCPAIFENIPWSTSEVMTRTLAQAERLGLRTALTPPWYDVDSPADVQRLLTEMNQLPPDRLVHTRQFFRQHPISGVNP